MHAVQPAGSTNGTLIEVTGLRCRYGSRHALDDVSLSIGQGTVLAVAGPNGAGKTTLLNLLAGVMYPTAGHVTVFGLHRWREGFGIRRRSFYLPVQFPRFASETPYGYLRLIAEVYGLARARFHERLETLAGEMDLLEHLGRRWVTLSLGHAKKAGLIGTFLPEIELRIMDEPFAGGIDPLGMETLFRWIKAARDRGETVVFSTQVLDQAETVCDRILLLNRGTVVACDSPEDLIRRGGADPSTPRALAAAVINLTRARES